MSEQVLHACLHNSELGVGCVCISTFSQAIMALSFLPFHARVLELAQMHLVRVECSPCASVFRPTRM